MGTYTHNWQNYSQRARWYFATGYNREVSQTSSNLIAMAEIGQQLQDLKLANCQLVAALVDKRERRGRSPYRHNGRRNTKCPHRSPYRSPHRSPYRL